MVWPTRFRADEVAVEKDGLLFARLDGRILAEHVGIVDVRRCALEDGEARAVVARVVAAALLHIGDPSQQMVTSV